MQKNRIIRKGSQLLLWIIPLPFLESFYQPGRLGRFLIAGSIQAVVVATAAWSVMGRRERWGTNAGRRGALVAPALLIANWTITSLALNMSNPPRGAAWLATQSDQQFRYCALVAGGLIALFGLAVLAGVLRRAGEKTLSTLAFSTAAVSLILFAILFAIYPHATTARFEHEIQSGAAQPWWSVFNSVFFPLQMIQRLLIYLALVIYAVALLRVRLLGKVAITFFIALTVLLAAANVAVHIPPAVPLVLPYFLGVLLLGAGVGPTASDKEKVVT